MWKEKRIRFTVQFEKITQRLFLAQDYFKALSATNLKAAIAENKGLMEVVFDVRNKKAMKILEGLRQFLEKVLLRDKSVERRQFSLTFFFYKMEKNGTIII